MESRAVLGPLFTHAGFQSWFLVCLPGSIVAVPMGFWFAITANKTATMSQVSGLAGPFMARAGEEAHEKHVTRLAAASEGELRRSKGQVTYPVGALKAIACITKVFSSSEIVMELRKGRKTTYGILNALDHPGIVDALTRRYGALVKT
jgi:hypothetical protein